MRSRIRFSHPIPASFTANLPIPRNGHPSPRRKRKTHCVFRIPISSALKTRGGNRCAAGLTSTPAVFDFSPNAR